MKKGDFFTPRRGRHTIAGGFNRRNRCFPDPESPERAIYVFCTLSHLKTRIFLSPRWGLYCCVTSVPGIKIPGYYFMALRAGYGILLFNQQSRPDYGFIDSTNIPKAMVSCHGPPLPVFLHRRTYLSEPQQNRLIEICP